MRELEVTYVRSCPAGSSIPRRYTVVVDRGTTTVADLKTAIALMLGNESAVVPNSQLCLDDTGCFSDWQCSSAMYHPAGSSKSSPMTGRSTAFNRTTTSGFTKCLSSPTMNTSLFYPHVSPRPNNAQPS